MCLDPESASFLSFFRPEALLPAEVSAPQEPAPVHASQAQASLALEPQLDQAVQLEPQHVVEQSTDEPTHSMNTMEDVAVPAAVLAEAHDKTEVSQDENIAAAIASSENDATQGPTTIQVRSAWLLSIH